MMDRVASRVLPAFAIGFALYYAPGYAFTGANSSFSWPMFTYFPAAQPAAYWTLGLVPGNDTIGPPMWWYGWIAGGVVVGLIFAAIAMLLPEKTVAKPLSVAIWVVPLVMFVFLLNWELSWFIPGWQPITLSSPPAATAPAPGGPPPAPE